MAHDKLLEDMVRSRKILEFSQTVRPHVAINDPEVAQQRWIQEHTDRVSELVRLYTRSGSELVARVPRKSSDRKKPAGE